MASYRFEPAGRVDSSGYHPPSSNYSSLENAAIDYEKLRYDPLAYAMSPGEIRKGKPHLGTAIGYATDKLFDGNAKPVAYPIPAWIRAVGATTSAAMRSIPKGQRDDLRTSMPTRSLTDAMLTDRTQLTSRIKALFRADPTGDASDARIDALIAALEAMGTAAYPVPALQKQALLVEAMAIATKGNLSRALTIVALLRQGLDPVAAREPSRTSLLDSDALAIEEAMWRTAQILASAGGDGFDTLLNAGVVFRGEGTASLPGECDPVFRRKQQALRVFLEATAQATEAWPTGSAHPSQLRLVKADRRDHATRAALKLWTNPHAGGADTTTRLLRDEWLTPNEKIAYYEWLQGFGKPGAQGMAEKARDRLHKLVTTWFDRAQTRGVEDAVTHPQQASSAAFKLKRAAGMEKSPLTALQFGTRGAHLRYPAEVRTQYDTLLRSILRAVSRHFEAKFKASSDINSLVANAKMLEYVRYWCQQSDEKNADGFVRRPLEVPSSSLMHGYVMHRARTLLDPPAEAAASPGRLKTDRLTFEQRKMVVDGGGCAALPFTPLEGFDRGFSLARLAGIVDEEGIQEMVIPDELLSEFGLDEASRKFLPPAMAGYRLFGNQGDRPATLGLFIERARQIRNGDELRPMPGADGDVIAAIREFNDTYVREEPLGPRVRAQDGGVLGVNNVGVALNIAAMAVAPDVRFTRDKRAFFEYNSGGHAFEVAFGTQNTVGVAAGASIGLATVHDGRILAGTLNPLVGADWTNQEAVRIRGRRELNEYAEALLVADDPARGVPPAGNHGRAISIARDVDGTPRWVDQSGRQASSAREPGGVTRYTYVDNGEVVYKASNGVCMDAARRPLLDAASAPIVRKFETAYVFADDGAPAHRFARMDKARFHLMQATDFIFEQAQGARASPGLTAETLWSRWVDTFFDNEDVSLSYQHHRNVGQTVSGQITGTIRQLLHTGSEARPGGSASLGYTQRTYEALNRADQTGTINRTLVQVGYSGFATAAASMSVGVPSQGLESGEIGPIGLPSVRGASVSATLADQGVLASFRTVEIDGKIVPEFTYMDIEYRNVDLYLQYIDKNKAVWQAFYGKANFEKHLEKVQRDAEPNQRFSERWRLCPEGAHKLRTYLALAKIHGAGARHGADASEVEAEKLHARTLAAFAAEMLEDRAQWDPLGAYVVEVNSKERAVGINFGLQAQQVTRSVADAELEWIGGSSAAMNGADRTRHERDLERRRRDSRLDDFPAAHAQLHPEGPTPGLNGSMSREQFLQEMKLHRRKVLQIAIDAGVATPEEIREARKTHQPTDGGKAIDAEKEILGPARDVSYMRRRRELIAAMDAGFAAPGAVQNAARRHDTLGGPPARGSTPAMNTRPRVVEAPSDDAAVDASAPRAVEGERRAWKAANWLLPRPKIVESDGKEVKPRRRRIKP
jgi:hypothetical protein